MRNHLGDFDKQFFFQVFNRKFISFDDDSSPLKISKAYFLYSLLSSNCHCPFLCSRSFPLLWLLLQSSLSFALNEGIMSSFSATLLWQKSEIKNKDILHTYQTTAWTFMAFDYHKNGYNQLVHFHIVGKIYLIWMSKTKLIFIDFSNIWIFAAKNEQSSTNK